MLIGGGVSDSERKPDEIKEGISWHRYKRKDMDNRQRTENVGAYLNLFIRVCQINEDSVRLGTRSKGNAFRH